MFCDTANFINSMFLITEPVAGGKPDRARRLLVALEVCTAETLRMDQPHA
jgi:hypothetical protein